VLKEAVRLHPGYTLLLTGHSMGAAAAALLTLMLHAEAAAPDAAPPADDAARPAPPPPPPAGATFRGAPLLCLGFACPGVASLPLADHAAALGCVRLVVNELDPLARASVAAVDRLLVEASAARWGLMGA
jgi:hypothetical protein